MTRAVATVIKILDPFSPRLQPEVQLPRRIRNRRHTLPQQLRPRKIEPARRRQTVQGNHFIFSKIPPFSNVFVFSASLVLLQWPRRRNPNDSMR